MQNITAVTIRIYVENGIAWGKLVSKGSPFDKEPEALDLDRYQDSKLHNNHYLLNLSFKDHSLQLRMREPSRKSC